MSTKNTILEMLERNRDINISGEQLASSLNISRTAVHKAIKELREDGYIINAITNKGYKLSQQNDIISSEGIRVFLNKRIYIPNIFVYKSVPSTNQIAKQLALDGAKNGTIVIANEQTAGRGRMGRSFFSPPDSGIYMSIILRPNLSAQKGILITTFASVVVCYAIEKIFNVTPKIKWVNDIILNGKKICGILTEAVTDFESGNIEYAILGIGVNFSTKLFPDNIKNVAGSLKNNEQDEIRRNKFIAEILEQIFLNFDIVDDGSFISEYKKRSIVLGKEIEVINGSSIIKARAIDIDKIGGLIVEFPDGKQQTLTSGEISIKGAFYNE